MSKKVINFGLTERERKTIALHGVFLGLSSTGRYICEAIRFFTACLEDERYYTSYTTKPNFIKIISLPEEELINTTCSIPQEVYSDMRQTMRRLPGVSIRRFVHDAVLAHARLYLDNPPKTFEALLTATIADLNNAIVEGEAQLSTSDHTQEDKDLELWVSGLSVVKNDN